jgi:hypothetical protein
MADETKTYLVNIESNLKKYADDAAEAKKKVDELKASNDALKSSGTATQAEIESSTAALKNANTEYKQAQKMVQLQVAANSSETGSRKQLNEILRLQMLELGKLGDAYTKNAQGMDVLNPKYTEQMNRIADTKQQIIDYDKALNDGRSNIGRYGESVDAAFAGAASKVMSMVGPMALVAAGGKVLGYVFDQIKDAIMSTTPAIDAFNKYTAVMKQYFYDLVTLGQSNVNNQKVAAEVADKMNKLRLQEYKDGLQISQLNKTLQEQRLLSSNQTLSLTQRMEALNNVESLNAQEIKIKVGFLKQEFDATVALIQIRPKDEALQIKAYELATKMNDAYAEADQAMKRVETTRTGFLKKAADDWIAFLGQQSTDELKLESLKAKGNIDLEKAALKDQLDYDLQQTDITNTQKEIKQVEYQQAIKKIDDDAAKKKQEQEDKDFQFFIDYWDKKDKKDEEEAKKKQAQEDKDFQEFINYWDKEDKLAVERQIINDANRLKTLEIRNANEFAIQRANLKLQYDTEIKNANKTGADIEIINKNYALAQRKINELELDYKLGLVSNFTNALGDLLGQQTAIGKAAAIATTTIDTYVAAQKAYKTNMDIPPAPVWGVLAAAAAIVAGLARVRQIMAVSTNVKSGSSSVPSSISASPATQHVTNPNTGTSILQPQMSQQQLNAIPNTGLLNAADIAAAIAKEFSKMKPPVVTVEDINAKIKAVNKVVVRANI